MHKSKPILILKTFDPKELKQFEQYLLSPLHNKNTQILKCFNLLKKHYPLFKAEELDRHILYQKLFKQQTYQEQKLRYLFSDLTKHLEAFIAWLAYQETQSTFLIKAYTQRNLSKYIAPLEKQLKQANEKQPYRGFIYYENQYHLSQDKLNNNSLDVSTILQTTIQALSQLDDLFLASRLQYTCYLINHGNIYQEVKGQLPKVAHFLPTLQHFLAKHIDLQTPIVQIYFYILMTLLESEEETYFFKLMELLEKYEQLFERATLHDMYIYARNYCVRKKNQQRIPYDRHLFNLYKRLLEGNILTYNDQISERDYKNITALSLLLEEHHYAENFITNYKKFIPADVRKNAYTFNMAQLYFYKKNFNKVLELINEVEFTDPYYHADSKLLILKSYYELGEIIPLFNTLETFRNFLRRNKIASKTNREVYLNYLKYIKKLVQIRLGKTRHLKPLQADLAQQNNSLEVKWVKLKLADLIK